MAHSVVTAPLGVAPERSLDNPTIWDGYQHVEVLTRDPTPGGIWSAGRVYEGLIINNIQGEYRFSNLDTPPPSSASSDRRLSGQDLQAYMAKFVELFLPDRIRYNTEVLNVRATARGGEGLPHGDDHVWAVVIEDTRTKIVEVLEYDKLVLCSGGCSEPHYPLRLSPKEARLNGFQGPVIHSSDYGARMQELLDAVKPASEGGGTIVVIGGGKSASDMQPTWQTKDGESPWSSRLLMRQSLCLLPCPIGSREADSSLRCHLTELRTSMERFLHTTWLGGKIVHGFWDAYNGLRLTLETCSQIVLGTHANNQGSGALGLFYRLVNEGAIDIIAPARVMSFSEEAQAVILNDGRMVRADAVVLGTGYTSSWNKLFDDTALQELGLGCHAPQPGSQYYRWDYTTLVDSPAPHHANKLATSSIYRGLVPAKNIFRRNFAINGAIFTTNAGYAFETSAHWITSYFRGDKFLRLPSSVEEAMASAAYNAEWLRRRYPDIHMSANNSVRSDCALWCWPQILDTLLDDMQLQTMRSGGNALTWPFQVIDVKEIAHLKEEREALRGSMS
ncbi:uncharacterized protein B0H18DRAFT_1121005 [Fomitopsis serialis]|uniref:uncharacterized protein n=1 Tax=Fomitopsis serialis TaxID=139415 RepID=UPI002007FA95|nr:uncharacterized protein B0H18DRAFT_1121005 [Neoantrodia serialis]KAH9922177.1 hypothetical protein B0H18DRAFT_1121005 [Neoantrodia serialis]